MTLDRPAPEGALPAELARWVEAELLTQEQAEKIASFEAQRTQTDRQGKSMRAIALLGSLTLVSGMGSLVAYNWERFGSGAKLFGMGVLLFLAVAWNVRAMKAKRAEVSTRLDVSLLLTTGLTLTSLALVSQVYHQDGALWQLLFVWCALTAPLMSYSRTRFAHYFWLGGLLVSLLSSAESLDRSLRELLRLEHDQAAFAVMLVLGALLGLLAAGFSRSRFSGRRAVGLSGLQLLLVVVGLFGGVFWLVSDKGSPVLWALGAVSLGSLVWALPSSAQQLGWGNLQRTRGLLAWGVALAVIPLGFPVESGFLAFLAFLLFWGAAWYLAESAHHVRNARLAVGAMGIRIVIASFELFESLLFTGLLLVGLGAAALAWSRYKWSTAEPGGASHD
jgi:uncharacterized membrane protein